MRSTICLFVLLLIGLQAGALRGQAAQTLPALGPELHMSVSVQGSVVNLGVAPAATGDVAAMPALRITLQCVSNCENGVPYQEDLGPAQPAGISRIWSDPSHQLFAISVLRVNGLSTLIYDFHDGGFSKKLDVLSRTFPTFTSTGDGQLVAIVASLGHESKTLPVAGTAYIWNGSAFQEDSVMGYE